MRGCGWLILVIVGVLFVVGISVPRGAKQPAPGIHPPAAKSEPTAKAVELPVSTSAAVMSHYEANEVRADEDMKGKYAIVTGVVGSIGKDLLGSPYITMKTSNPIASCQFIFSNEAEAAKLSGVNKGETLMIAGKCEGKLGNVLFRKCQFVPSSTPKKGEKYVVTLVD